MKRFVTKSNLEILYRNQSDDDKDLFVHEDLVSDDCMTALVIERIDLMVRQVSSSWVLL